MGQVGVAAPAQHRFVHDAHGPGDHAALGRELLVLGRGTHEHGDADAQEDRRDQIAHEETPRLATQAWQTVLADISHHGVGEQGPEVDGPDNAFFLK